MPIMDESRSEWAEALVGAPVDRAEMPNGSLHDAIYASLRQALVMGDLVLFEDEVSAAMSAALDNGLEVTALFVAALASVPRHVAERLRDHADALLLAAHLVARR